MGFGLWTPLARASWSPLSTLPETLWTSLIHVPPKVLWELNGSGRWAQLTSLRTLHKNNIFSFLRLHPLMEEQHTAHTARCIHHTLHLPWAIVVSIYPCTVVALVYSWACWSRACSVVLRVHCPWWKCWRCPAKRLSQCFSHTYKTKRYAYRYILLATFPQQSHFVFESCVVGSRFPQLLQNCTVICWQCSVCFCLGSIASNIYMTHLDCLTYTGHLFGVTRYHERCSRFHVK